MENLSPESKVLYELLMMESTEEYERRFLEYKRARLDTVKHAAATSALSSETSALASTLDSTIGDPKHGPDLVSSTSSTTRSTASMRVLSSAAATDELAASPTTKSTTVLAASMVREGDTLLDSTSTTTSTPAAAPATPTSTATGSLMYSCLPAVAPLDSTPPATASPTAIAPSASASTRTATHESSHIFESLTPDPAALAPSKCSAKCLAIVDITTASPLNGFVLESTQLMLLAGKNPWPPPSPKRSTTYRNSNLHGTMDTIQTSQDWQLLGTVELKLSAALIVIIFVPGVQNAQLQSTVFKWSDPFSYDMHLLIAITNMDIRLDLLLARRAMYSGSSNWSIRLHPLGKHAEVQFQFSYPLSPVNCHFEKRHFLLSGRAQMNVVSICGTSLNLVVYCGYPALNIAHTRYWMLIIVGHLLQYGLEKADALLLLIYWLHESYLQLLLRLLWAVPGYIYCSYNVFLVSLNGRAEVHHILQGNPRYYELMQWSFNHSQLQSEFRFYTAGHIFFFCGALMQWKIPWKMGVFCIDVRCLSASNLDFLLARRTAHIAWNGCCLHRSLGSTNWALEEAQGQVVLRMPWQPFSYHWEAAYTLKPCSVIQDVFGKLPLG